MPGARSDGGTNINTTKNELADQSDVRGCVREVTAALGDTALSQCLSASDGAATRKSRDSRDVAEYQNVESSEGACSHPESPNCDRGGDSSG